MKFFDKCACSLILGSVAIMPVQSIAEDKRPYSLSSKLAVGYDDNLRQTDDVQGANTVDSAFVNVRVDGGMSFIKGALNVGAYATTTRYSDSSVDDYTDAGLTASLDGLFEVLNLGTRRTTARIDFDYGAGTDPIGATDRASNEPETYHTLGVGATLGHGFKQGRIEAKAAYNTKRYDEFSSPIKTQDTNTTLLGGTFFYKVRPKTELLFEVSQEDIDYIAAESSGRDNLYQKALVGVKWEATAKTTGTAKVGYGRKDFEQAGREDANDVNWEVGVDWQATKRSTVSLSTSRSFIDTTSGTSADYVTNQNYDVSLQHQLTRKLNATAGVGYSTQEYDLSDREDDYFNYSVGAEYRLHPQIVVGGSFQGVTRDSSYTLTDYDRNIFSLYVTGKY